MDAYEKMDHTIRTTWFKDHEPSFLKTDHGHHLKWSTPDDSWCNRVLYTIMDDRWLVVRGDLGCATYWWSGPISWDFLAGCGIDYFASKCEASENGKGHREWNTREAERWYEWWVKTQREEDNQKAVDKAEELRMLSHMESEFYWDVWIREHGQYVLGPDWWDVELPGKMVSMRCRAHLIGIQMALERSKTREEIENIAVGGSND